MIRRAGNFGFVDDGAGNVYSFDLGAAWNPSSFMFRGGSVGFSPNEYISVCGTNIIPFGVDNDLPGRVCRLLEKFYAGEGIMSKKAGLQWGEGPRLYRDAVDESNVFYRQWLVDHDIEGVLSSSDYLNQMHRCLIDLCHLEGFWVKIVRTRGGRLDNASGRIARVTHVPAGKVRFVYNGVDKAPTHVMVADFPNPDQRTAFVYPLFDPANPMKHPVSMAYYNIYSYNHDHYSVPRFIGAFDWIELAGTLAPLLSTYNANASAISKHIVSPQSYWDDIEARLKEHCKRTKQQYTSDMLERVKDAAMEQFASNMSGRKNAGKFLHTSTYWNEVAKDFEGWKIEPIDNKVKEYIEAQVAICKKAEAAATSGFGLDPSLSNLILDTKLGSGSEKLYALKVYNATETSVPDMVLCMPWQMMIDTNFPGAGVKIGLYRTVVDAEKNVSPENRIKANA